MFVQLFTAIMLPKIQEFLHWPARLPNERIKQREIGIIRDGRIKPMRLREAAHQHQPLFHDARRALDVRGHHGRQFR